MTQNLNSKPNPNILAFQQKQMMMMMDNLEGKQVKLSFEQIKKMERDYVGMYYGFVSINWGQGMSLGMAWQKGLEQMDAFVASKMKIANHPVNKEFLKIHKDWRRYIAERIMTSEYAEEKLEQKFRKGFVNYGTKRIKETKSALNGLYEQYMPKQNMPKKTNAKSFNIAKQNIQRMLLQQMIYQRAA